MEQEKIIKELTNLPPAAQRQVAYFIAFLRTRYKPSSAQKTKPVDILKESFIGIWKEREDLSDSVTWVRRARRTQWRD
jgi:hypothetical protein